MVLQSVFTAGLDGSGELDIPPFATLVLAIVFGWLLVSVWQRVLENFSYETLGLNSRSTVHAIIVAVILTVAFLAFIWMIDEYDIVPAGQAAGALSSATEELLPTGSEIQQRFAGSTRYGHPIVISPVNFY